jgi:hypothetical protein
MTALDRLGKGTPLTRRVWLRAAQVAAISLAAGCGRSDLPSGPDAAGTPWRIVQQDPCEGRVQDRLVRAIAPVAQPARGDTYQDPAFGTFVTRVTAVSSAEGENAVVKPMYSTMPAWNADESLLILWHRGKGHELYEGEEPYRFLRALPIVPTDIEHVLWDPADPAVLYYPNGQNNVPTLVEYRIGRNGQSDSTRVLHDFSTPPTSCPTGDRGSRFGLGADPEWMGYGPRKLLGLMCGVSGYVKFLYSIAEDRVIASAPTSGIGPITTIAAPSELFVYLGGGYVIDTGFRLQRQLTAASYFQHSNVGRSARGYDTWNAVSFDDSSPGANDQGALVSHRLDTGQRKVVIGPATGYPYVPSSTHISAIAARAPGWVAVGMVGIHQGGTLLLDNEIVLANVDTGQVCRVAHARTFAGTTSEGRWGYWSETHLNLSPTGTRVLFGSDWMNGPTVDTYVVDLRKVPR